MAGTISVACKLPTGILIEHGKIVMQDGKPALDPNTNMVKSEGVKRVRIYGTNYAGDDVDADFAGKTSGPNGYAITRGVDADWWADWTKTHPDYPPLANGSLFALAKESDAKAKAREHAGVVTGMEPVKAEDVQFQTDTAKLALAER